MGKLKRLFARSLARDRESRDEDIRANKTTDLRSKRSLRFFRTFAVHVRTFCTGGIR